MNLKTEINGNALTFSVAQDCHRVNDLHSGYLLYYMSPSCMLLGDQDRRKEKRYSSTLRYNKQFVIKLLKEAQRKAKKIKLKKTT